MSTQTFNVTSSDFWIASGGHVYSSGKWQGSFFPGTTLSPDRGVADPYTYEYVGGNSFWETYADKLITKIRVEGINEDTWLAMEAYDLQVTISPNPFSYTSVITPSYAEFTFTSTVLLSELSSISIGDQGTDYGSLNGYDYIGITLDGLEPETQMFWQNHLFTYEEPYLG